MSDPASASVEAHLGPLTISKFQATERADLDTALARLPEAEAFLERNLRRIEPFFDLRPPARVLDVGAAQGVTLTACAKRGFEAVGVEPWSPQSRSAGTLPRRPESGSTSGRAWPSRCPSRTSRSTSSTPTRCWSTSTTRTS